MNQQIFVDVGGSSGIGMENTRRLSEKNHSVLDVSRSADRLSVVSRVTHLPVDVTRDTIGNMAHCPGSIRLRPFHRLKEEDFIADWRINFFGAVNTIQSCLPALKKAHGHGSIKNVQHRGRGNGDAFSHFDRQCQRGSGGADPLTGRRVCTQDPGKRRRSVADGYAFG